MKQVNEIREIFGQMTMLSLISEQSYDLTLYEVGRFKINQRPHRDGVDVEWIDERGESRRLTRENIEWVLYEIGLTEVEDYLPEPQTEAREIA